MILPTVHLHIPVVIRRIVSGSKGALQEEPCTCRIDEFPARTKAVFQHLLTPFSVRKFGHIPRDVLQWPEGRLVLYFVNDRMGMILLFHGEG